MLGDLKVSIRRGNGFFIKKLSLYSQNTLYNGCLSFENIYGYVFPTHCELALTLPVS